MKKELGIGDKEWKIMVKYQQDLKAHQQAKMLAAYQAHQAKLIKEGKIQKPKEQEEQNPILAKTPLEIKEEALQKAIDKKIHDNKEKRYKAKEIAKEKAIEMIKKRE